jgi:hypothetical protein
VGLTCVVGVGVGCGPLCRVLVTMIEPL